MAATYNTEVQTVRINSALRTLAAIEALRAAHKTVQVSK